MSELKDLSKKLREVPKKIGWKLADEAVEPVVDALESSYPAEHVRTGAARNAIEGKARGAKIQLKAGVRKKKSKSGRRRRSRTGKVNYGQFLPYLLKDEETIKRVLESVMEDLDAL